MSFLIKHIIYPVHGIITGRPVLKRARELEKTQWLSPSDLRELQWNKLRKILIHAQTNVPYYRRVFEEAGVDVTDFDSPSDMSQLPILTKDDIHNNLKALVADGVDFSDLKRTTSSGSTGKNVIFYHDKNCRAYLIGAMLRNRKWFDVDIGDLEIMIWGSSFDLTAAAKWSGRIKSYLEGVKYISAYQMKPDMMMQFINYIRKCHPPMITGYTSALEVYARFMLENNITDIRPKAVISSAEMLFQHQRELIEKAFGCKVFNRYGCREFGTIAHECKCGSYHISAERVHIETVRKNNCTDGLESGELLVTDLDNYGYPMIRYRIGDIAQLDDSDSICDCGRGLPLLKDLQGRAFDIIKTSSGRSLPGTFWTILTKCVPGIIQLQIIQKRLDYIIVNLTTDKTFPKDKIPMLVQTMKDYCGQDTDIAINLVGHIEPGPSGKFNFIISEINNR